MNTKAENPYKHVHLIRNERIGHDQIPLPLPEKRFKQLLAGIRAKGRFVRDRAG